MIDAAFFPPRSSRASPDAHATPPPRRVLDGDASSSSLPQLDPQFRRVVVAVNATAREVVVSDSALAAELQGRQLGVHPALAALGDEGGIDGVCWDGAALRIPPLTAAVLVERR